MAAPAKVAIPRRGEVYVVRKTRPALVIQNDVANRHSPITIVAALTSQFEEPLYPTEVLVRAREGGLQTDSVILLNHIRSIDRRRLIRYLGRLRP
ncbi:MAG: PemK family transcriptional regulator, partial [Candidatus Rokubacteria bacterium RIFCSPLOWO2_02_FULL_71_18]